MCLTALERCAIHRGRKISFDSVPTHPKRSNDSAASVYFFPLPKKHSQKEFFQDERKVVRENFCFAEVV